MRATSKSFSTAPLIICEGNSLTEGTQVAPSTYPAQLAAKLAGILGRFVTVVNDGHSGETVYNMIASYAPVWTSARVANTRSVAVLWEGTNAIGLDQAPSASSLFDSTVQWGNMFRANGTKTISLPIISRSDFTAPQQAMADEFNALLVAGWKDGYDAFVDLRPTFPDPYDSEKYDSGHLHLTSYGYGLVAELVKPTVLEFITP